MFILIKSKINRTISLFCNMALKYPILLSIPLLMTALGNAWISSVIPIEKICLIGVNCQLDISLISMVNLIFTLALFFTGSFLLIEIGKSYIPVKMLEMRKEIRKSEGLIWLLSTPNPGFELRYKNYSIINNIGGGDSKVIHLSGQLDEDILILDNKKEKPSRPHNFSQLLKSIKFHKETLKHVVLINSTSQSNTSKGSEAHVDSAIAFLKIYLDPNVCTFRKVKPVDFESFSGLYETLDMEINYLIDNYQMNEDRIMIDITGGQKVSSIAAAMATLHRPKLEFQYIGTDGLPVQYNVVSHSNPNT